MQTKRHPSLDALTEKLEYQRETGLFIWKVRMKNGSAPGSVAGKPRKSDGQRVICLDGRHHYASRLAWYFVTGKWPLGMMFHLNGDISDNRFENLRERLKTGEIVSKERLMEVLHYNPDTGEFHWKIEIKKGQVKPGSPIGHLAPTQRKRLVSIDGVRYACHRLAWFYFYGVWPKLHIDHINGDFGDNRIANLREATRSQNMHNRRKPKNNTSGHQGVSWHKGSKKWKASIGINGKRKSLGSFDSVEMAASAYRQAALQLHGEYARFE